MTQRSVLAVLPAVLATLLAGVALSLAGPAPAAYAHNAFSASTPKDKAVLDAAPAAVTLKFLAKLNPTGTTVTVTGPAGESAAAGTPTFDGPTVSVPFKAGTAGAYTASYEVASADGHPIRGKITFTLTAAAVPSPTPSAVPNPSVESPSPAAPPASERAATATLTSGEGDRGTPWWPWLVGGVVLVAAAVVVGTVLVRRRS